jgi:hypothetical protein
MCEFCLCRGIVEIEDEEINEICPMCIGTGYHRSSVEGEIDSLRRWSVLRMLDLTFPEHKHRDRTQRLMSLFHIVPFPEEPRLTEDAIKLVEEKKGEEGDE